MFLSNNAFAIQKNCTCSNKRAEKFFFVCLARRNRRILQKARLNVGIWGKPIWG